MATKDLFDNQVGEFTLFDASEADITFSAKGGSSGGNATCMNAQISYNIPIQPVATFGKDVVFSKGTPQGTFTFGQLAGNSSFQMTASKCEAATMSIKFGGGACKIKRSSDSGASDMKSKEVTLTLHNAVFTQFQVQGTAQDAFFTENTGGFFHYLTREAGR